MARTLIITLVNQQQLTVIMQPGTEDMTNQEIFTDLIQNKREFTTIGDTAVAKHAIATIRIMETMPDEENYSETEEYEGVNGYGH